jgi:hypothetical protein
VIALPASHHPRCRPDCVATRSVGMAALSACMVLGRQLGQRDIESPARSAAIAPGPPPLVMIASRLPLRAELRGQRLGGVEQLPDVLHAHDAERGGRPHRKRYRSRRPCRSAFRRLPTRRVATGLEQDDRLDARRRAQRAHEAAGVADAFDVEQDVVGAVVVNQVVEDLAEIDVRRAAQRDDAGKADAVAGGPVENGRADGARLRNQRQIADVAVTRAKVAFRPRSGE